MLILLPLIYFTFKYFKITRLKSNGNNEDIGLVDQLTEEILKIKGEIIDLNELNKLFGIDNLTAERRRVKRSKLINEINHRYNNITGDDLIIRKRDGEDKRYVRYKIGVKNK